MQELDFFRGKRVLVTGHTGFKGAWLCRILVGAGAIVTGYSLPAPTSPALFDRAGLEDRITSVIGDIRDFDALKKAYDEADPEIVLHLAAQPIVRESYQAPRYTYETNVMGTVNLLECVRLAKTPPLSVVNVTTDKVYLNRELNEGFTEDEPLDGFDPYSNSKSCSELVTHSYKRSFLDALGIPVSTARAGNVIGGGDFAADRIVPDCVRAATSGREIIVRNPFSTRPYQHVLEPLFAYLRIARAQALDHHLANYYNVGPDACDCVTTGQLATLFCSSWGEGAAWRDRSEPGAPHEAGFLKLDCALIKRALGWSPRWHIDRAVDMTCRFSKAWFAGEDIPQEMDREIAEYGND